MKYKNIFLGLGSNLGDREVHLQRAIALLEEDECVQIKKKSTVIETEPIGHTEQGAFLNQVIQIETSYDPYSLLQKCLKIEKSSGRIREEKWGPRTLDIDILFFGETVLQSDGLKIPHPEVSNRAFVLLPLAEIAPTFQHPVSGQQIEAMLHLL
jgi:2-amino-4-hydroxy-6-hydroxymethyldihydropteridine diphosphokinase